MEGKGRDRLGTGPDVTVEGTCWTQKKIKLFCKRKKTHREAAKHGETSALTSAP